MNNTTESTCPKTLPARLAATARRFAADASATTAIEYAIMSLIAVAIIVLVSQVGTSVNGMYEKVVGIFN